MFCFSVCFGGNNTARVAFDAGTETQRRSVLESAMLGKGAANLDLDVQSKRTVSFRPGSLGVELTTTHTALYVQVQVKIEKAGLKRKRGGKNKTGMDNWDPVYSEGRKVKK